MSCNQYAVKSVLLTAVLLFAVTSTASSQVFDEQFDNWPLDLKINGKVIVAGEVASASVAAKLIRESDRKKKVAVVSAGTIDLDKPKFEKLFADAKALDFSAVPKTKEDLEALLSDHDVVVFVSEGPLSEPVAGVVREAKEAFAKFLDGGKTLVMLGDASEMVAQSYFEVEDASPPVLTGLDLLADCVLETNFDGEADQKRLLSILNNQPRSVGIGLDKNTAMVLSGRRIKVAGKGRATFILKGNERQTPRIRAIASTGRRSENVMLDLPQWRIDAIERTLPVFPAEEPRKPFVKNGTLIIVGGGGSPRGLTKQMIELAGGVDKAKLVYVPCSEEESVGSRQGIVEKWKRSGVKQATFIHTKDRNQANADEDFLEPLKDATGIYFGGGRQWNFSDSYYGTKAHKLMKEVLDRGGVIAGSSAGASIQGRYLARATPIGNSDIMAFGYQRGGLGFLDGVAIDQHFSQRRRHKDMSQLVKRYPQLLGIGIDESTAIIVQKSNAKVIGRGKVHFYDSNMPVADGEPDYVALGAGSEYDLAQRKVLKNSADEPLEN